MRIFANANYPFLSWRNYAFTGSAIIVVGSILAMGINYATTGSWVNYGVDFAGGTMVQVNFAGDVSVEQIRDANPDWEITSFGDPSESEYLIRVPTVQEDLDSDPAGEVTATLEEEFGEDAFQVVRSEGVSARVGSELQQRALLAILISFALTLVYIAFRFEWRFGVAAIIATAHDIIFTLGFVAATRMEVSVATIAAFLTIVGYSLNDTIVIFDRIREELTKQKRGETFESICDRGVNETLPRTVLTGLTSMATLLALFIFGGTVIRDFALVLIVGVVIGMFSTVFVATPSLYLIEKRWPRHAKKPGRPSSSSSRRQTARV